MSLHYRTRVIAPGIFAFLLSIILSTAANAQHSSPSIVSTFDPDKAIFILQEDLEFIDSQGKVWSVPAGFGSDGLSIPQATWSLFGSPFSLEFRRAAFFLDYYSEYRLETSKQVHRLFYEILLADGTSPQKAKVLYFALLTSGAQWDNSRQLATPSSELTISAVSQAKNDVEIANDQVSPQQTRQLAEENVALVGQTEVEAALLEAFQKEIEENPNISAEQLNELVQNLEVRVAVDFNQGTAAIRVGGPKSSDSVQVGEEAILAEPVLPQSSDRFFWYHTNPSSNRVIVFVHGVLSNVRTAWLSNSEEDAPVFWPEIVRKDPVFSNPSIFLAGYYSEVGSGQYDVPDASNNLGVLFRNPLGGSSKAILDYDEIVIVAHSLGGIVVRNFLEEERELFSNKKLGLVLMASPSLGSKDADRLSWLIDAFENKQGERLRWRTEFLTNLDRRFRNLVEDQKIPNFVGAEAVENHFIIRGPWYWPFEREVIVSKESGGRYFRDATIIPQSDHFSIVKPASSSSDSHLFFVDFFRNRFLPMTQQ